MMSDVSRLKSSPDSVVYSELISSRENALLFALLGPMCSVVVSAVAQVYESDVEPNGHKATWTFKGSGVVCLVWDQLLQSYFLRLYSVKRARLLWEQEVYIQFEYSAPRPFFHTFPADNCQAALNFADEGEAERFLFGLQSQTTWGKDKRHTTRQEIPEIQGLTCPFSQPIKWRSNPGDLCIPTTFRHSTHMSWKGDKGFDMNDPDPALQKLFTKAGITHKHLGDKHTSGLIYDIIEQHGGLDIVQKEMQGRGPPPKTLPKPRGPYSRLAMKKGPLPSLPSVLGELTEGARGLMMRSISTQHISRLGNEGILLPRPHSIPAPPSVPAPKLPIPRHCQSPGQISQSGVCTLTTSPFRKERDTSSAMEPGNMIGTLKKAMEQIHTDKTRANSLKTEDCQWRS